MTIVSTVNLADMNGIDFGAASANCKHKGFVRIVSTNSRLSDASGLLERQSYRLR